MPGEVLTWVTGPDLHITRLRHFLSLRYYYQQITAYRAVLTKFLDDFTTSDNLGEQYVPLRRTGVGLLQDCVRCCAVLINLVELVLQASEEQVTLNGAWWLCSYYGQWPEWPIYPSCNLSKFNVLTAFNASLVLCGILIVIPKNLGESWITPEKLSKETSAAFWRGIKVMKSLDRGSAMISRCLNVLDRFAELLDLSGESRSILRAL
jgi:hypothetical protein